MRTILLSIIISLLNIVVSAQAIEIKSPNFIQNQSEKTTIFLGGTIDMGNSEDWQAKVTNELKNERVILLNPRRDDWNTAWKPVKEEPEFLQTS